MNNQAIFCVTENGIEIAKKINEKISSDVFVIEKFNKNFGISFTSLKEVVNENFKKYKYLIFIMATGIVVRTISKYINKKDLDPAVIVIDENITFAISLISGHIGGGNLFTKVICDKLNIIPIITTSSDITGKIAIDTLAEKLNCNMKSLEEAKNLTSLIVDNKNVGLSLPKNVNVMESKNSPSPDGVVIISNREKIEITQLYPKDIILGVGCRRGVPTEIVLNAIKTALKKANISEKSIKHIANIKTRRLIKLLSNTDNISAFMRKAPRTKTSLLNKYGVNAQINENKELVLPTNNVADLNRVLEFLNEDIFRGVITDRLYRSNSKKKDNH